MTQKNLENAYLKGYKEGIEEGVQDGYKKFKELKKELLKELEGLKEKIKAKANKLYCTAEHLGYHDKNCEGVCEKTSLKRINSKLQTLIRKYK